MANLNSPRTVRLEVTGRVGKTFAEFMRVWDIPFCSRMVLYISQMILDLGVPMRHDINGSIHLRYLEIGFWVSYIIQ